jgi:hypothetical protein
LNVSLFPRLPFIAIAAALAFIPSTRAEQTVEADNGAAYRVMGTHIPYDHNAPISIEVYDNNNHLMMLMFDCKGHIMSEEGWHNLPSRSVAAQIAQLGCKQAKR